MGLIAKVLSFVPVSRAGVRVSEVKFDSGGGLNITGENFAPVGEDSKPLDSDYCFAEGTVKSGGYAVLGYVDTKNIPKANAGDKRVYARGSDGVVIVEVWLKNDGSAIMTNANGSFELKANGDVTINGVTIDASGNISTPGSIAGVGIKDNLVPPGATLGTHVHPAIGAPPTPGT